MPKLSANLNTMFGEVALEERFEAAAEAGFRAVEILLPYAAEKDVLAQMLDQNDLACVLLNMPAGDWDMGDRGLACLPHRQDDFIASVETAIEFARALRCPRLHCMAGGLQEGVSPSDARHTYVENLKRAADMLLVHGLTVTIEPINTHDVPGYFLNTSADAMDIIRRVEAPNLKLQFDLYHAHMMDEDIEDALQTHLAHIAHIQISDAPGRHEPGTGTIDYQRLLPLIDEIGYENWVGCEYVPVGSTLDGLGWAAPYLQTTRNKN